MDDGTHIDEQELRVAVVMNGGVSLAVWMGGVTRSTVCAAATARWHG